MEDCKSLRPTVLHLTASEVGELRRRTGGVEKAAREALGGSVKLVQLSMEGVPESWQRWLRSSLGCAVVQSYWAQEVGGPITMTSPTDMEGKHVGVPGWGLFVQLRDVMELGLRQPMGGVGEVWVRGASVASAYLRDPALNAAAFRDGWLGLGDVGSWRHNGTLRLVGRKLDMFRLGASGELVDPGSLEAVFRRSELVGQVVVLGNKGPQVVALVEPRLDALAARGLPASAQNDNAAAIAAVLEALRKEAADEGLPPTLVPVALLFVPNFQRLLGHAPWPRPQRAPVVNQYANLVRALFSRL